MLFFQSKQKRRITHKEICRQFFSNSQHQWIQEDHKLNRLFLHFFMNIPEKYLSDLWSIPPVFVRASGRMSCAINFIDKTSIVIVFPDLYQLLKSASPTHGMAILAHELGHIIHNHSNRKVTTLKAQVEADMFACELGFSSELADIISEHSGEECRIRLEYLQYYISTVAKAS